MTAAESIPFEHRALNAEQVGALLGYSGRHVLERIACKPGFPRRVSLSPATWIAGEVLAWREEQRLTLAGRRGRRR